MCQCCFFFFSSRRRHTRCSRDWSSDVLFRSDSMSTPSNTVPGSPLESQVTAPAVITASRRMYWSVRRELWENRSEEHTSELQSRLHLVCRLLLEKKKKKTSQSEEDLTTHDRVVRQS